MRQPARKPGRLGPSRAGLGLPFSTKWADFWPMIRPAFWTGWAQARVLTRQAFKLDAHPSQTIHQSTMDSQHQGLHHR